MILKLIYIKKMKWFCVNLYVGDGQGDLSHVHVCRFHIDKYRPQSIQASDFLFLLDYIILIVFIEHEFSRVLQFSVSFR